MSSNSCFINYEALRARAQQEAEKMCEDDHVIYSEDNKEEKESKQISYTQEIMDGQEIHRSINLSSNIETSDNINSQITQRILQNTGSSESNNISSQINEMISQNPEISVENVNQSLQSLNMTPGNVNVDNIKEALNNVNLSEVLKKVNPDDVTKMIKETAGNMSPEMVEKARKLAMNGQGDQIMREMQKRGINARDMKEQIKEQQRLTRASIPKDTIKAVLITTSRQLKSRDVSQVSIRAAAIKILRTDDPVELSCSRLAHGSLVGKTLKAWYDPNVKGTNKRASKIIGFQMAGELLVVMEEGDLSEKDFLISEKNLV